MYTLEHLENPVKHRGQQKCIEIQGFKGFSKPFSNVNIVIQCVQNVVLQHFIFINIIFNFYIMIFNTNHEAGLSWIALCYVLKLKFYFETNKPFDSC